MALNINGTTGISGVDGSASAPAVQGTDSNTGVSFGTDTVNINTGGSTRAIVDSSGRLLLGTTTEGVGGADEFTIGGSSNIGMTIRSGTTSNGSIFFSDGTSGSDEFRGFLQYQHNTDDLTFGANGSQRMIIKSNGDIGIGTSTVNQHFVVHRDSTNKLVGQFLQLNTSFTSTVLQAACARNTTNESYNHFKCSINGVADKMFVRDSGDVDNTNNSYGGISDVNLKENIVDASSQWDDIKNIRIRKFNFKDTVDPNKPTLLGVIAQEVEDICPNLVKTSKSMQGGEEKDFKSFKYSVLYMKAIKCLQEAQAKIETLETEKAKIQTDLTALTTRVTALEAG